MKTQLAKWGNSLAVRIPREIAESARLNEGDDVELAVSKGSVVVKRASMPVSLDDLVDRITPENRHQPVDWGRPRGKEVW